jgi:hypothetical protein
MKLYYDETFFHNRKANFAITWPLEWLHKAHYRVPYIHNGLVESRDFATCQL